MVYSYLLIKCFLFIYLSVCFCLADLHTSPQHPETIFSGVSKEKDSPTLMQEEYLKPHTEGQGVHVAGGDQLAFIHSNRAVRGHAVLLKREHLQPLRQR